MRIGNKTLVVLLCCLAQAALAEAKRSKASSGPGGFATGDSTVIDFSETSIDGKFQAPQGFLLQGKKSQSLSQMVRLRSKFRSELRNSKAAVKALVK